LRAKSSTCAGAAEAGDWIPLRSAHAAVGRGRRGRLGRRARVA